jgi:hypothetical protein
MTDVHELLEELLTDYDLYTGEPAERDKAIRRLVNGAGCTAGQAKALAWYVKWKRLDNPGGWLHHRIRATANAKDLIRGAVKQYELHRGNEPVPAGVNMSGASTQRTDFEERALVRAYAENDLIWSAESKQHTTQEQRDALLMKHYDVLFRCAESCEDEAEATEIREEAEHWRREFMKS